MGKEEDKMEFFRVFVKQWAKVFNVTPEEAINEISECVGKEMIEYF